MAVENPVHVPVPQPPLAPTTHHARHSPVDASPKNAHPYPPVQSLSLVHEPSCPEVPVLVTQTVAPAVKKEGLQVVPDGQRAWLASFAFGVCRLQCGVQAEYPASPEPKWIFRQA
jgi:hypothetical protein